MRKSVEGQRMKRSHQIIQHKGKTGFNPHPFLLQVEENLIPYSRVGTTEWPQRLLQLQWLDTSCVAPEAAQPPHQHWTAPSPRCPRLGVSRSCSTSAPIEWCSRRTTKCAPHDRSSKSTREPVKVPADLSFISSHKKLEDAHLDAQ